MFLVISDRTTGTGMITFRGPNPDVKTGSTATANSSMFLQEDASASASAFTRANDLANFVYSPDGRLLAQVIKEKPVAGQKTGSMHESRFVEIFDVSSGSANTTKPITRIPPNPNTGLFGVEDYIYWSPQSRYLVTWQPLSRVKRAEDGNPAEGNLKIWDVRTGVLLISWIQEDRQGWPVCRWTPNERLLLRLNQGQLHIFDWMQFAAEAQNVDPSTEPKKGATATDGFSVIEGTRRETLPAQGIAEFSVTHGATAVFVPEKKGMPARVSIFRLNDGTDLNAGNKKKGKGGPQQAQSNDADDDVDPTAGSASAPPPATLIAGSEPSAQKAFFKADDVQMVWHNRGLGVLVLASTLMDASGKSYYGETSLYYLQADGKFDANVTLEKQGPIHAIAWNPKGNDFAVTYGFLPSKTTLFNRKCKPLGHLGTGSRNTLMWSPHGRVLCVGGFGALSGDMDFWDTAKLQKLGTCTAYCSSSHQWSPDGRYLMCSVLFPRLRVDNGIKIFNVSGEMVWTTGLMKELVGAQWQAAALEGPPTGQPPQYTYPRGQYNITMPDLYPDVQFNKISLEINAPGGGLTSASTQAPIPGTARENPFGSAPSSAGTPAPVVAAPPPKQPVKQPAAKPTSTGGAYRHPHWSGSTRSVMTNEQEGPSKVVTTPVGTTQSVPIPGATKVSPQQQQRNLPVGYVPANKDAAGPSKAALRNKAKRERKRQQKQAGGADDAGDEDDE
jgi:uncharacterized protein with WD repeat